MKYSIFSSFLILIRSTILSSNLIVSVAKYTTLAFKIVASVAYFVTGGIVYAQDVVNSVGFGFENSGLNQINEIKQCPIPVSQKVDSCYGGRIY